MTAEGRSGQGAGGSCFRRKTCRAAAFPANCAGRANSDPAYAQTCNLDQSQGSISGIAVHR